MSKQISTKTTIRNLTAEIKKTFVKKDAFTPVQTAANAAIKSLGVDGNTVNFYTSTDKSGTAAFSVDFPSELFLDQTKTTFVAKFKFDAATYPGATVALLAEGVDRNRHCDRCFDGLRGRPPRGGRG